MSKIQISEMAPTGLALFQDPESFLHELNAQETQMITGGVVISQVTVTAGFRVVSGNDEPGVSFSNDDINMVVTQVGRKNLRRFRRWLKQFSVVVQI